jgi:hypothetical protein
MLNNFFHEGSEFLFSTRILLKNLLKLLVENRIELVSLNPFHRNWKICRLDRTKIRLVFKVIVVILILILSDKLTVRVIKF